MKQAKSKSYPKLVKRIVGNSKQELMANGGTPTDVDFTKDGMVFNGTSSKINYNLGLNGTYSVRIKCNPTSFGGYRVLFDCRSSNNDGAGVTYLNVTTGSLVSTSGTKYINGVVSSTIVAGNNNEVVVTGMTLVEGTGTNLTLIGSNFINGDNFLGTMDLIEIYAGTLTPSEVSGLYKKNWNHEQVFNGSPKNNITGTLDFTDGWGTTGSGAIVDANTFTATSSFGGAIKDIGLETGKKYRLEVEGTTDTGIFAIRVSSGVSNQDIITVSPNGIVEFVVESGLSNNDLYFRNNDTSTTTITNLTIQELNPKTIIDFDSTQGAVKIKINE